MKGYLVSQMTLIEAGQAGLSVFISPSSGCFIQADGAAGAVRKFLSPQDRLQNIPEDAFEAVPGRDYPANAPESHVTMI